MKNPVQLREDARAIWQAGVDAVLSEHLVRNVIARDDDTLTLCGHVLPLAPLGRIAVVGAGKAGAGMAAAVEKVLGDDLLRDKVTGWINVPADCVRDLKKIHLHSGRPAGVNEPTGEGVEGSRRILEIIEALTPSDLCLVLLSGGGSALLPAPIPPITLAEKRAVTRILMRSGASIHELNTVRQRLSQIKGGGLARASHAGRLVSLIISDVIGDRLDMIASGPTTLGNATGAEALRILEKYDPEGKGIPESIRDCLASASGAEDERGAFPGHVTNHIIGRNANAVDAASREAGKKGFHVVSLGSANEGEASAEGRALAERCRALRDDPGTRKPVCILSGGEPIVHLAKTDKPRKGGRNQELVLAGLEALGESGMDRIVLLSGGTDGEDGPTNAAGAWADAATLENARRLNLDPRSYLEINNTYNFFDQAGGLIMTGPTHTNVMDLRVALVGD